MRKAQFHQLLRLPVMGALVAAAATALAAGPAAAGPGFGPRIGGPNIDTGNWAGYAAYGAKFTTITGTWIEPVAKCTSSNNLVAPWVGLDGYNDTTVEQTGAQVSCSSGSPRYSAWYEMFPANPVYWSNPVSAGDTMTATVTHGSGTSYTLTMKDVTKGWSHTVNKSLNAQDASAEAILESPPESFPKFPNNIVFNSVMVNGTPLSTTGNYKLAKLTGHLSQWVPGPLNSQGGFTIKHT